ncbi:MAG TPA: hypothetical protein VNZ64_26040 [Candidatus Acidoferrum sp.]|nr:hypothetical protein [Candidatus Acidoferrum sp.]
MNMNNAIEHSPAQRPAHGVRQKAKSYQLIRIQTLFGALALAACVFNSAKATTIFPIATNAASFLAATSGTNYLAAILSGTNVCFQLLSTNGTSIGPLTAIGSGMSFPLVAFGGGKYLVYWDDNFISSGPSVYGQLISPNGALVGSQFFIPSTGLGAPRALASDGTNFLAVMEENGNDYYGQIVTAGGTLSGSPFLISSQHGNGRSAAAVFGKTNFLVVWQSNNSDVGLGNKTYGEFVTSSGSAASPFQVNQTDSTDQDPLAIAFDGTNYLVVWMWDIGSGTGSVTNWDLYGRLVSQVGTFPGSELHLITDPGSQYWPSLTFDGANYLLAWGDNPGGAALSSPTNYVRFQFLNRSASAIGPEFNLFTAQGTNVPAFIGVVSDGNNIAAVATLGSPIVDTNGNLQGFASASVYGAFIPTSAASPILTVSNLVGTQFALQLAGTPGINYAIQISTNLALSSWTAVITNSPTNGTFSFTDTHATNASRFYRSVK